MSTTVITAFYESQTKKNVKRFRNVLKLNVPMIVFTNSQNLSFVEQNRPIYHQTKIEIVEFKNLNIYKYKKKFLKDDVMMSYAKMEFLQHASQENYFRTDYLIWINYNCLQNEIKNDVPWPERYKIKIIRDRFLIINRRFDPTDSVKDFESYLSTKKVKIETYVVGGTKSTVKLICNQFWNLMERSFKHKICDHRVLLQYLILKNPEDFYSWNEIKKNNIVEELSLGTCCGENYATNENLKVLAAATREVSEEKYKYLTLTAQRYGYDLEILGRDQKWENFATKTKLCADRIKTVKQQVVAVVDATDVFFAGPSDELYEKFADLNKDLIIGSEHHMFYRDGRHEGHEVKAFFQERKRGLFAYPNGGFLMGTKEKMHEAMELRLNSTDDQAGMFDMMYEGIIEAELDYDSQLVANIGVHWNNEAEHMFEFDGITKRFTHKTSHGAPCVIHFPGKNFIILKKLFKHSQDEFFNAKGISTSVSPNNYKISQIRGNPSSATIIIMAFLILFLVVIMAFVYQYSFKDVIDKKY